MITHALLYALLLLQLGLIAIGLRGLFLLRNLMRRFAEYPRAVDEVPTVLVTGQAPRESGANL